MIIFLAQQLIFGCIMTMWENSVKVGMGVTPNTNEFIMAHLFNGWIVVAFKVLFALIIVTQIIEIKKSKRLKWT